MNLWQEDSVTSHTQKIRTDIEMSRRVLSAIAVSEKGALTGLGAFCDTLERINRTLGMHEDAWRRHRAFLLVDLPAIVAAVDTLSRSQASDGKRHDLIELLDRAFEKAEQVASDLSDAEIEEDILSLSVLDLPEIPERGASVWDNLSGRVSSVTSSLTNGAGKMVDRVRTTGGGLYDLAGLHIGGTVYEMRLAIVRPVSNRLSALSSGIMATGSSALFWGAVGAILFPPLAPFLVGESLLALPESYARHLAALNEEDARADLERKGKSRLEIDRILAALKGSSLRFETSCLSMSIDTLNGTASGIILRGHHLGENLEDLDRKTILRLRDTAPDPETRQALDAWLQRLDGDLE